MSRSTVRLVALLATAVVVSVVHYLDNTVNYDDYPRLGPDSPLWDPPQWVVGGAWFVFTAAGAAGLIAYLRGRRVAAAIGLAVYSGSGLVGILHYAAPDAFSMPWWRQAHVLADITCGVAIFAVTLALATGVGAPRRETRTAPVPKHRGRRSLSVAQRTPIRSCP